MDIKKAKDYSWRLTETEAFLTSKGITSVIDRADYELVKARLWRPNKNTGYMQAYDGLKPDGRQRNITLHRFIMGLSYIGTCKEAKQHQCVDHIDRDKLNNRRSNLRLVSHSENLKNASPRKVNRKPRTFRRNPLPEWVYKGTPGRFYSKFNVEAKIIYVGSGKDPDLLHEKAKKMMADMGIDF